MTEDRYPSDLVAEQYRLIERIGSGGFAEVWAAEHRATSRRCALKILRAGHLANPMMRARFEREGEILGTLDHPNIARAIDCAIDGGLAYIAMELVEGITLGRELRARARAEDFFTADAMNTILRPIGQALDYAHLHGVLHRDLKPGNIILTRDGVVRLLDFGIAKMLTAPTDMETTVGRLIGSKHYISPEQILSQQVDARSDVFALATVVFLMVTHRMAWARTEDNEPIRYDAFRRAGLDDVLAVIDRIVEDPRPRASDWREGLSPALDELLMRGMARDPEDRPASASAFVAEVEEALVGCDAFTRIVDADEHIQTVLVTQMVENWMVIDDELEPIEVLDLTPGVIRVAGVASLSRSDRVPIVVALLGLVILGLLVALGVMWAQPSRPTRAAIQPVQPVQRIEPAASARHVPAARALPIPTPPPPPPPVRAPTKRRVESVATAPPKPPSRVRRILKILDGQPGAEEIETVRAFIVSASKDIPDRAQQTAIERCAVGAAVVQDAAGLRVCGRRLEKALKR